jgi:hypothetical protein
MPASRRDIAAESAASVASLTEFVHGFQSKQLRYVAITASPLLISVALRHMANRGRR